MAEPWIRRSAGELLTAAVWNDMQSKAQDEIHAVEQQVTDSLATAEARMWAAIGKGARVQVDYMKPGPDGTRFETGIGQWSNASGGAMLFGSENKWGVIPSPSLTLTLKTKSLVLLSAEGSTVGNNSSNLYLQFILKQAGKRAPARVNPALLGTQLGYTYEWPGEPNAQNWQVWLDRHDAYFRANAGCWPLGGINRTTMLSGIQYTGTLNLDEAIELPPGEFQVQVGFCTNSTAIDRTYSQNIPWLSLRAIIIPV